MTTPTPVTGNRMMEMAARPRRSLEDLVDRLIETLFREETDAAEPGMTRWVHEARRLRQADDIHTALGVLAGLDLTRATPGEARWACSEWQAMVRRPFSYREVLVCSQGTGLAAALVPANGDGTLEAAAVPGMRWRHGSVVSRPSLRGLRPLVKS